MSRTCTFYGHSDEDRTHFANQIKDKGEEDHLTKRDVEPSLGYSLPGWFTDECEFHPIRPQAQVIPGLSERYHQNLSQKQNDLMTVMVEQHRHSLIPPLTLTMFSGDPIEYM